MATHTFDETSVDLRVYSYREGLLSAVAHDLELRATRLKLTVDVQDGAPRSLRLVCPSDGLRVVTALRDGRPLPDALSAGDRQKIERNLMDDVLHSRRHPDVRLDVDDIQPLTPAAEAGGFALRGVLHLHGRDRPLQAQTRSEGGRQVAEVTLHQPDFGIQPFSAMLGALRVRPDVRVRLSLPWP